MDAARPVSCMCDQEPNTPGPRGLAPSGLATLPRALLKAPVHLYRWTLKPLIGQQCRHMPSCSDYALGAIEGNGAWRGFWLTLSRIARCHPWGTHGYDPVPDVQSVPFWRVWRLLWAWRSQRGL